MKVTSLSALCNDSQAHARQRRIVSTGGLTQSTVLQTKHRGFKLVRGKSTIIKELTCETNPGRGGIFHPQQESKTHVDELG